MRNLQSHLLYARYVFRHKYFVGLECFKVGLYWRGLVHDLSKFLPDEWFAYARFFHGGEQTPQAKREFLEAWRKHLNRNDHHFNHHCIVKDDGSVRVFEMSESQRQEMICDWLGVQRALGQGKRVTDLRDWYLSKSLPLGPKTKRWVEETIGVR